jgi:hypothetical protein
MWCLCVASLALVADLAGRAQDVRPMLMGRLQLPVYGSEHLLVIEKVDEGDDKLLPLLLSFEQGTRLERELIGTNNGDSKFAVTAAVVARKLFFEQAAGKPISLWDAGGLVQPEDRSLTDVMLRHLRSCGLTPVSCALGSPGSGGGVTTRDMGAFTDAAPAFTRTADLPVTLLCEREAASPQSQVVELPLESIAEAVLFSRAREDPLPLRVTVPLWEQRAVAQSRLPPLDELWIRGPDP